MNKLNFNSGINNNTMKLGEVYYKKIDNRIVQFKVAEIIKSKTENNTSLKYRLETKPNSYWKRVFGGIHNNQTKYSSGVGCDGMFKTKQECIDDYINILEYI